MELKNNKSAWAALATLGVTAIAAGATAFVKVREKRRKQREETEQQGSSQLTAEQQMVYNEAVSSFLSLNERIYELRSLRKELQPLILWLASDDDAPKQIADNEQIVKLAEDIKKFLITQMPFINACLSTLHDDGTSYVDYVRGPVGGTFDNTLDEEPTGADVKDGTPIQQVLKLGYYFPDSRLVPYPVKAIVTV